MRIEAGTASRAIVGAECGYDCGRRRAVSGIWTVLGRGRCWTQLASEPAKWGGLLGAR